MEEPERKMRTPKISKEYLKELLHKIGVDATLPKRNGGNKVDAACAGGTGGSGGTGGTRGYLTSARCVDSIYKRAKFRSLHTYRSRLEAFKQERLFVPEDTKLPGTYGIRSAA